MGRYTVISADCHGGGSIEQYRDYVDPDLLDEFDGWAADFVNPYRDLSGPKASQNWDSSRRLSELEADGIVGEVIFPNTVPPFFATSALASSQSAIADAEDLRRRWAGLRAHNRWLADFCQDAPGRRAGVFQIMLHDIDAAVAEVKWAREAGLSGGVLLPGAPPGSGVPPLYRHSYYDRLWEVCADLGVPVNCHGGGAGPRTGTGPLDRMFFLLDLRWWDINRFRQLILGGVLERHPGLRVVFTESGVGWIPKELQELDGLYASMRTAGDSHGVAFDAESGMDDLSMAPSKYWHRQCYAGATFIHPTETAIRGRVGVDKLLWGSDYPHLEASYPYSKAAIQTALKGVPVAECEQVLAGNAARIYGFDLERLRPLGEKFGPSRLEVAEGIDLTTLPADAADCPAFAGLMPGGATVRMGDNRGTGK
ncbi:amidohydrolase family protein [Streptomyces sp. WSLK1-5]|uniref:amidohydrolase family protein n=1 Tax=unclassified Streptomyces TaxID=2593676 RepID=UPI003797DFA6